MTLMNDPDYVKDVAFDEAGFGRPIVWLHPFPLAKECWQPQFELLADVGHHMAIDSPGFGGTPLPENGWTVDGHADLLAAWLDFRGIGEKVIVGGVSMGGYVAMAFARRHADRLAGLVLANTRAEADTDEGKQNREKMMALVRDQGAEAVIKAMLPKLVSKGTSESQPIVVEAVRGLATAQSVEGIVSGLAALRDRPDALPGLANVNVPTLVLVGSDDELTPPAAAETIANAVAGSRLEVIPGAGHLAFLEKPQPFADVVRDFLLRIS